MRPGMFGIKISGYRGSLARLVVNAIPLDPGARRVRPAFSVASRCAARRAVRARAASLSAPPGPDVFDRMAADLCGRREGRDGTVRHWLADPHEARFRRIGFEAVQDR